MYNAQCDAAAEDLPALHSALYSAAEDLAALHSALHGAAEDLAAAFGVEREGPGVCAVSQPHEHLQP